MSSPGGSGGLSISVGSAKSADGFTNPIFPSNDGTQATDAYQPQSQIQSTDNNALFTDDEPGDPLAMWSECQIRNEFEYDFHRYMAGITTPSSFQGATAAFFQLAAPTLLWICDWTVCRVSKAPDIPNDTPADDDWIILDKHMEPANIDLTDDRKTPIYRISGTYVYGHQNPGDQDAILNLMNFSRPPWISTEIERNVGELITSSDQIDDCIDSGDDGSGETSPGAP